MKTLKIYKALCLTALTIMAAGCKGTWIMYDQEQKDHLYFEVTSATNVSFSLTDATTMTQTVPVKMMGMPRDHERVISLTWLDPEKAEAEDGTGIVKAVEGTDFTVSDLVIPAGEICGNIVFTINRTEGMKTAIHDIRFSIAENDDFLPLKADSTSISKILTPVFDIKVSDGEPLCPDWWDATAGSGDDLKGWTMYLGKYYPAKFRKMLEFYHDMKAKNPIFYEDCLAKYGENLDKKGITKNFFASENPAAWASYVLIPLCEYYKTWYSGHPDDPNVETIQTKSGTSGKYWRDPIALLR
ncbi:MAG: hypothetical protein SPF80_05805 [Candidatus Cryptobacteroides sp.]|nr:hypothetical protein [Bacteroidales bacterium]MDY5495508.1 hypothetical protein [Candidatus Cryptobacteroides sp.]